MWCLSLCSCIKNIRYLGVFSFRCPSPSLFTPQSLSSSLFLFPVWLSVCLTFYLSVCLSTYLSIPLSISFYLFICLCTYLYIYLSIQLSLYLSICLSVFLSIHLFLSIYIYPSVCLSTYLSTYLSIFIYQSIYPSLSIYLYIHLSIHLSIYISIYLIISQVLLGLKSDLEKYITLLMMGTPARQNCVTVPASCFVYTCSICPWYWNEWNEWCFRSRCSTVKLYWAGNNLVLWDGRKWRDENPNKQRYLEQLPVYQREMFFWGKKIVLVEAEEYLAPLW